MRKYLLAGWIALGGIACATTYDDFMHGMAVIRTDRSAAVDAFTKALNAGDLPFPYVPTAHYWRGRAYMAQGDCAAALADFDQAAGLVPDSFVYLLSRAGANRCLKKTEAALSDYQAALKLRPEAGVYRSRADYLWSLGRFAEAATDYLEASDLQATLILGPGIMPYNILWYALSADRAGKLDVKILADRTHALKMDEWPGPLLALYLGKTTPEAMQAAAKKNLGSQTPAMRQCEADFYLAEWQLAHGADAAGIKALLEQAVKECPHNYLEYGSAKFELGRQS